MRRVAVSKAHVTWRVSAAEVMDMGLSALTMSNAPLSAAMIPPAKLQISASSFLDSF